MPLLRSRAFGVGVQMSISVGATPPPPQFAEAAAGARRARATRVVPVARPALSLLVFESKPISFVGLRG
jgi:hypothetical protein